MRERTRAVERRLVSVGRAPVPAPRAAFAEALEDRLRAVGALSLEPAHPPVGGACPRSRPRLSMRAAGLGLVGSAMAAVAMILAGGSTAPLQVRVTSATNTLVVLPDGTVDEAAPGLVVPDGSRLLTGDEGRVVAGKVELGPNREAMVDRGTVRPSAPGPIARRPSLERVGNDPTRPDPAVGIEPPPAGELGDPEQDKPSPAIGLSPSTDQPEPTDPGPESPAPAGADPSQPKPEGTTGETSTSTSPPKPSWLRLAAHRQDGVVSLSWSIYEGRGFAAYLVLRTETGSEPRYPLDRSTTVVARVVDRQSGGYLDAVDGSGRYRYRVVAVDAQRRMLAGSPVVAPEEQGDSHPTVRG